MARQEEMIVDAIVGMKRALLQKTGEYASDDPIKQSTNHGNKTKRKAEFVQEGRLDNGNSVKAYKKRINYNGYFRDIISKNPPHVDVDGDVVDDDGEESDPELEDAEEDPYKEVRIEDVLMPLTSAANLRDHPTLSLPYTSKALNEMIQNVQEMVHREQRGLERMKRLFEGFRGDSSWLPVDVFEAESDLTLLIQDQDTAVSSSPEPVADGVDPVNWDTTSNVRLMADMEDVSIGGGGVEGDVARLDMAERHEGDTMDTDTSIVNSTETTAQDRLLLAGTTNDGTDNRQNVPGDSTTTPNIEGPIDTEKPVDPDETMEMEEEEESPQPAHRMTTRAKAQAATSPLPSRPSSPDSVADIHPMFLLAESTMPSNNMGLSQHDADETRRVISAYVQKQEDVVASSWKLYNGLLKAKRMRDDVLEWCTAEGHVGEMSDGEDWVDLDKWGLVEGELEKGKEEEEEEIRPDGGSKKTRNARRAANVQER